MTPAPRLALRWLKATLLASATLSCAPLGPSDHDGERGDDRGDGTLSDQDPGTTTPEKAKAVLEIHALDIWAQPLPVAIAELDVSRGSAVVPLDGASPSRIYLDKKASFTVTLGAAEHEPLEVVVDYDGGAGEAALAIANATKGHGAVVDHVVEEVAGRDLVVHRLHLGLRHKWFSAEGRPARRGNRVDVYMDGEETWKRVYSDMKAAKSQVLAASWWWESDFELLRPSNHAHLTPQQRWQNTMLGVLESNTAIIRVLVGQFWGQDGILSGVTVDDDMLYYAAKPNDGIEYMGQANETEGVFTFEIPSFAFSDRLRAADPALAGAKFDAGEALIDSTVPSHLADLTEWPISLEIQAASYHQKFSVVDHEVAWVGGMNVKATDWDTSQHHVFDHRRMGFDATLAQRQDVMSGARQPDTGPRKDYFVRVEGPAAQDAADIFKKRWDHQIARGVEYSENASSFVVRRDIDERADGIQVQMTATLPEPFWEHAIAETWFNAVRNAERFIFIEDQYFRIPMLNEAIAERMEKVPGLRLVVVTKPVNEWVDPGCAQTYIANELFASRFPDRYMTLKLRSFAAVETWGWDETESRFVDIDVHSKVLIVDDVFASIGSANKNNRGIVYEGELNVAIVDRPTVTSLRRRILANLMPGWGVTDDAARWWGDLDDAAWYNDMVYARWDAEGFDIDLDGAPIPDAFMPRGFVYTLELGELDDCLFESVGPDMTGAGGDVVDP